MNVIMKRSWQTQSNTVLWHFCKVVFDCSTLIDIYKLIEFFELYILLNINLWNLQITYTLVNKIKKTYFSQWEIYFTRRFYVHSILSKYFLLWAFVSKNNTYLFVKGYILCINIHFCYIIQPLFKPYFENV